MHIYVYICIYIYTFSFYRNVLQNTRKNERGKKDNYIDLLIYSISDEIYNLEDLLNIYQHVTWIDMKNVNWQMIKSCCNRVIQ